MHKRLHRAPSHFNRIEHAINLVKNIHLWSLIVDTRELVLVHSKTAIAIAIAEDKQQ